MFVIKIQWKQRKNITMQRVIANDLCNVNTWNDIEITPGLKPSNSLNPFPLGHENFYKNIHEHEYESQTHNQL